MINDLPTGGFFDFEEHAASLPTTTRLAGRALRWQPDIDVTTDPGDYSAALRAYYAAMPDPVGALVAALTAAETFVSIAEASALGAATLLGDSLGEIVEFAPDAGVFDAIEVSRRLAAKVNQVPRLIAEAKKGGTHE